MSSIKEILKKSTEKLRETALNPQKEAGRLLSYSLGVDPLWLLMHENDTVDIPMEFFKNVEKRAEFYPMEYILKSTSFYSKEFYTDERVLIPRPETELLVDLIFARCSEFKRPFIVEVGTGSGVISIVLATLFPLAKIVATDISEDALEVAKINAVKHGVSKRVEFINTNLFDGVDGEIDILVSNPPYIKKGEELDKNLSYEPDLALFGGEKGDEVLKQLIDETVSRDIGVLACEMGYDQRDKISNYLKKYGREAEFYKDLSGFDRGFILKSP